MTETLTRFAPPAPSQERRAATLRPQSYSAADNSIEVVWTTGAAVMRFDWWDGEYYSEELSTDPSAVRLDRLNAGAPFLDSHLTDQLGAVIGSVVPGSARMQDGLGLCRIRLVDTADAEITVAKIKAGHIRHVSVGYAVYAYDRSERVGEHPVMRAVDWEPQEISAVTVPADAGAHIRMETTMPAENQSLRARPVSMQRIVDACERASLSPEAENQILRQHAGRPMTEEQLTDAITAAYVESRSTPQIRGSQTRDLMQLGDADRLRERMAGAISARLRNASPAEESAEFMGTSMIDMVRGLMLARGERVQFLSPTALYERAAAMTTSDFPLLLNAPMGAYLNEMFRQAAPVLQALARPRKARDFKPLTSLQIENASTLDYIPENGEYSYAAFAENGQAYSVKTFGKIFSLSRPAIINDNLGAFAQATIAFIRSAAGKRAEFLAAIVSGNAEIPSLNGALLPIFHPSHGNISSTGLPITVDSLSAGRMAMRNQKDINGTPLDVVPKYLVVGPEKETEAETALTALNAATVGDVNPFAGKLTLMVDARLQGKRWWLFADPAAFPVLEYATLEGNEDVFVDTRQRWNPDGVETKVRIDFGAAAVDYRGAYLNPGD
ncbi:Prophage Clp protease-like protein [Sphingobium yanoikuyae]|uniref:Prophage Clp protease-like protein n=1 Tax=Sphingobium yanoikuyae TaxID=13690 RepID=A0A084EQ51_SPHYA|nr:prohead protease/major capsid protein fusion protein [Sphingobium yanoikuyae]KEZ20093.1 Prophage Clp protease-like protein [Sphingobium yanoikuyae]